MSETAGFQVFLSYGREDGAKVQQLYVCLKADGYRPWLDEESILPGDNWQQAISRGIRQSELFVACLSQSSTGRSGYVNRELREALVTYAREQAGEIVIVPLLLDDCEIPDLVINSLELRLRDYNGLDGRDERFYEQLVRLIAKKRGVTNWEDISVAPFVWEEAGGKKSVDVPHNLPLSGAEKFFVGREQALIDLQEALDQSGRLSVTAVHGMGSVGKSELALQYAYRAKDDGRYPGGICWVNAREAIGAELTRFGRICLQLEIPSELPLPEQIQTLWQKWNRGMALIV
ncbi:MAG: toll/interleukin-1 receptor domain-containing protein [Cyanobacteria bacterium P01_H01_bin.15]